MYVKVCGITSLEDARLIAELGIWALGFIFVPSSPRWVSPDTVREILKKTPSSLLSVGVFQDLPWQEVKKIREFCSLDLVQLHGEESPDCCQKLGKGVIKTFGVDENFRPDSVFEYQKVVDYYLFDTKKGRKSGGQGVPFDWTKIRNCRKVKPFLIGGGLNQENILACIFQLSPFGVDLNSGVEIAPGKKDPQKVRQIVNKLNTI